MKKFALFVFNGDPMCFIHVLLNAIDMSEKGHEAKIIIEGAATKLIRWLPTRREAGLKYSISNHLKKAKIAQYIFLPQNAQK